MLNLKAECLVVNVIYAEQDGRRGRQARVNVPHAGHRNGIRRRRKMPSGNYLVDMLDAEMDARPVGCFDCKCYPCRCDEQYEEAKDG